MCRALSEQRRFDDAGVPAFTGLLGLLCAVEAVAGMGRGGWHIRELSRGLTFACWLAWAAESALQRMQKECVDGWSKESSRTGFCPIDLEEAARLAIHVIQVFCGMRLWREDGERARENAWVVRVN